ncbi:hypothetical protein [Corynebacterium pseudotuberculosis]|uniref:hypothetical protein n=1 Tax=Corynebacterium pseudotuberculosis TaxID=1719 RepID=UPI0012DB5DD0|nr:hypothetical protein [Corynebacterium pseudotuberculosis]
MREMGFKVIDDYKENNRGKQAEFHGAIMVDGGLVRTVYATATDRREPTTTGRQDR